MLLKTAIVAARLNARNHGYRAALYDAAVRFTNRFMIYRRLQCLTIEEPDSRYATLAVPFRYRRFHPNEMREYCKLREYELDAQFLAEAADKGDECHAILHNDALASYGWYSSTATRISNDLELDFDHRYVYMYKGFTHRAFRGHRLHAIGMTLALAHYRSDGRQGLLSYVEAQNFDSLKSCYRMGYKPCGHIRFFKVGSKYNISTHPDCHPYGLRLYEADQVKDIRQSLARGATKNH